MIAGDELVIKNTRTNTILFGGYVRETGKTFRGGAWTQEYQVQDYSKLIADVKDGVTADYLDGTHTEKDILTELFAAHCPDISVGAFVITGELVSIAFVNSSLRRGVDDLKAIWSRQCYVDYYKRLHYFASGDEVAPFGLSTSPNNSTTFPFGNLEFTEETDGNEGGSLVCWHDGLFSGMTIQITHAKLGWSAKEYLINEIRTRILGKGQDGNLLIEYTVNFGTLVKARATDEMIRSGKVITALRIADAAIGTAKIQDAAITNAKIDTCSVSKLIAGSLTVEALLGTGGVIGTATSGARLVITPAGLKAYDSGGTQRVQILSDGSGWLGSSAALSWTAAGVLNVNAVNVSGTLSAANIGVDRLISGTITADVTISSTFQTAASPNARLIITSAGLKAYDSSNTQRVQILNDGSGWFGSSSDFRWTSAGVLSINGLKIDTGTVGEVQIGTGAVSEIKIASLAVTEAKIGALAVTSAKIAALAVTDAKINDCTITKLTAGNLTVVGTITTGKFVTGAAGSNRIEIDANYVAGYNAANTKQFYLSATDGKAYCGAGAVILDSTGIIVKGTGYGLGVVSYQDTEGHECGALWGADGASNQIMVVSGSAGLTISAGAVSAGCNTGEIYLICTDEIIFGTSNHIIRPNDAGDHSLGTSGNYWGKVYSNEYYVKTGNDHWHTFDKYDDLKVIKELGVIRKGGKEYLNTNNLPPEIVENGFVKMIPLNTLVLGTLKQIGAILEDLDKRLIKIEGGVI